jgi:hypothetical protein
MFEIKICLLGQNINRDIPMISPNLCPDQWKQINWILWNEMGDTGKIIACSLRDFLSVYPHLKNRVEVPSMIPLLT